MKLPMKSILALSLAVAGFPLSLGFAQGTAFTYQGRLQDGSNPATGNYDLQFALYDAATAGTQQSGTWTQLAQGVTNGLFTVTLDFGSFFPGADRWLELGVRTNGGGAFTTLAPRQKLTPTPYAIFARNVNATGINGTLSPANFGAGTITSSMIATGAVGTTQLAPGAVTTAPIADNAVTPPKLFTTAAWANWLTITNPSQLAYEGFGRPIAFGADRVAIGVQNTQGGIPGAGVVYLFQTNGTLLKTITNHAPEYADLFGQSLVAVGDLLLIGAPLDNVVTNDAGAVYLFNTNGTLLTTFTNPAPVSEDTLGGRDYFGSSLAALGKDRVLIGAPLDSGLTYASGLAYLFNTNGALLRTYTNPAPVYNEAFGYCFGVLDDNHILIGAPNAKVNGQFVGLIYLFNTNGVLLNTYTNPTLATFSNFGLSVAPVGPDRFLTAGMSDSAEAPQTGRAYLFSTNGAVLTVFTNPVPQTGSAFGAQVVPLGEGRVAISAPSSGIVSTVTNFEAVYIFRTNGTLLTTITNPVPQVQDTFATALAALGSDRLLIASTRDDSAATDSGVVHLVSLESYVPGLIADGVRNNSIATADLQDGAVTAAKLDPALGLWSRLGNNVFRTNGNVGVGVATPATKLHVKADSADAEISLEAGDAGAHRWTLQSSVANADLQLNRSFQIIDRTDGARRLLLGTFGNMAVGYSDAAGFSSVGMGYFSSASGNYSLAAGNNCLASGGNAVALGLSTIASADATFAAGTYTRAQHTGAFVWADNQFTTFSSTANNQFLLRATGGVGINTNNPNGAALAVAGLTTSTTARIQGANNWNVTGSEGDFRVGNDSYRFKIGVATGGGGAGDIWMRAHGGTGRVFFKAPGGTTIYSNEGETSGVSLAAGGTSWAVVSDRNAKKDFAAIDAGEILEKLSALPITQWRYKWEAENITPHIGPMAQDFKAAFYPGGDDKSITTLEADGVALAAIQGLNEKLEARSKKLEAENAELKARLDRLEKLLTRQN
ncbi:MAG: tail fiber domain-containing protein [Verrucomicrobiota bacterium]